MATGAGPEVIHARHGAARLALRLAAKGARRVLILCAPSRRFVDQLIGPLAGFAPAVFAGAKVHVPVEVVQAAAASLVETGADTLVALGGGSAIGLGKALKLERELLFAVVPTTYAGSEMTEIWGTTAGNQKRTGRDPRVRPDLVLYDPCLAAALPLGITVQSLMNALAHPISALSTRSLEGADRAAALHAAAALVQVMGQLLRAPGDEDACEAAQRAAAAASIAIDRGKGGAQHAAAHYLGGALGLEHAALHAVLLPHFVAHLRSVDPALVAQLEVAIGGEQLEARLRDLLVQAGAATSLDGLGVDAAKVQALVAARPDLPAAMILAAQHDGV